MPKVRVTIEEKEFKVKFDTSRPTISIGRTENNDLAITDASISKEHCYIQRVSGAYLLIDKGSTNGIMSDGIRVKKVLLVDDNQEVTVGDGTLYYSISEDEKEQLEKETLDASKHLDDYAIQALNNSGSNSPEKSVTQPVLQSTPSAVVATGTAAPRPFRKKSRKSAKKESNGFLTFLSTIILFVLGLAGGLCGKHYLDNDKAFLWDDYQSGKVKLTFDLPAE